MTLPRLLCRLLHRRSWTFQRYTVLQAPGQSRLLYHCPLCDRTWVKREGTLR